MPAALYAQLGGLSGGPTPYGNGVQPIPTYAGTTGPSNVLLVSFNTVASYNSNVLRTNNSQLGDQLLGLGPRFAFIEQHGAANISIDYQPYFQFYQHLTQYDRVNQTLNADATFALGAHWSFQVRDAFSDQTGTFQTGLGQPVVPGLGGPTALNTNIYSPLAAQRSNNSRADLTYRRSSRTSLSFFGGYSKRTISNQPSGVESLLDTVEYSSGMQYSYRLSDHTTFGTLYTFEALQYLGNLPVGYPSHTVTHSAMLSMAWKATPSVSLQVFGGPQYLPPHQLVAGQSAGSVPATTKTPGLWSWAVGGSLAKSTEKSTFQLSGGRAISDGGGLLTTVTSTYATVGVNRRLIRRWSASWSATGSESRTLNYGLGTGKIDSISATGGLDHPLTEELDARLSYTFTRQYSTGVVPFGASLNGFNNSIVSLTLSYQLPKIPLGR